MGNYKEETRKKIIALELFLEIVKENRPVTRLELMLLESLNDGEIGPANAMRIRQMHNIAKKQGNSAITDKVLELKFEYTLDYYKEEIANYQTW